MSRRSSRVVPPLAVAVAAAWIAAAPAAGAAKVIGHGVRLKGTKIWYAHATAVRPGTLAARVVPRPAQVVKLQWSIVCQKPNSADPAIKIGASAKGGQAVVRRAGTVKLALPYANAPTCVASVYATAEKEGSLVLDLLQT